MTILFILTLLGCGILWILLSAESEHSKELSARLSEKENEYLCDLRSKERSLEEAESKANEAIRELQNRKENFHRNIQALRDRLKHCLVQKHDSPGNIVDRVFKEWLKGWDDNGG